MKTFLGSRIVGFCAVCSCLLPTSVLAASFNFTTIAETGGEFSFLNLPSINNDGTVAFGATRNGRQGFFTGTGNGSFTTIVDSSGSFLSFGDVAPSINDNGTVAFVAQLDSGVFGNFTGTGNGLFTTLFETNLRVGPVIGFSPPSINNDGTSVFFLQFDSHSTLLNNELLVTGSGGPLTTIANTFGQFNNFFYPRINNEGIVAFTAGLNSYAGIFISQSDGSFAKVVDTSLSSPFNGLGFATLNDRGVVASKASFWGGGESIITASNDSITTIADTFGPYESFRIGSTSINNSGTVAFFASLDGDAGEGIFIGSDPIKDRVIKTGDALAGSTVVSLFKPIETNEYLNDAGQIAFFASLADGRSVIVRADPVKSVPEPSTVLSSIAVAFIAASTKKRMAK